MTFYYRLILLFLLFSGAKFSNAKQVSFEKDVVIVDFNDQSAEVLKRGPDRELLSLLIIQKKLIMINLFKLLQVRFKLLKLLALIL